MGTYPTAPRSAFTAWVGEHAQLWIDNAAEIGLSVGQATEVKNTHTALVAATAAQGVAKNAAKAATLEANATYRDLRLLVSTSVARIRAFAETSDKPSFVYAAANIDAPAPHGHTPPPGQPFEPCIELLPSGGLKLRWKCANPGNIGGVIYEVQRKMGPAGTFGYIGAVGTRSFSDENIPAGFGGFPSVTYRITGTRSTQRGLSADFVVNFGVGGGAGMVVTTVMPENAEQLKMAA